MAKNKQQQQAAAPAPAPKAAPQEIEAEPGFFGSVIKPGQSLVWENETEQLALQLTSAALGPKVTSGRSTLVVAAKEIDQIALCTLIPEKVEQCTLTHVFTPMDGPVTFRNEGVNDIHLTGLIDIEDDGDDEEEEDHHHGHDHSHDHHHDDSEDGSEDEIDMMAMDGTYSDSDSDGEVMVFGGEDDDDSDDDDEDDEEEEEEGRFEVIEERVHGDAGEKKKATPTKKEKEVKKEAAPAKKEEAKKEVKKEVKKEATPTKDAKKDEAANSKKRAAPTEAADASKKAKVTRVYKGVTIEETAVGKGTPIARGKKASILYRGRLLNGKQFDAQQNRKTPFVFRHGIGDVIKGMDIGIEGMRPGGKRTITIPAHLGYGKSGSPPVIPGNSTLIFEIELL